MQTRLKASLQNPSTPRARSVKDLERPGGESRLPAAIVPPPGLGKTVCKRKIDDQGKFLTIFADFPYFASLFQVGTKRVPKLTQKGPKWSQKHRYVLIFASLFQVGTKRAPKFTQKGPKWRQRGPRWSQKGTNGSPKQPKGCQKGAQNRPKCAQGSVPQKRSF